jgi:hypothetical protein
MPSPLAAAHSVPARHGDPRLAAEGPAGYHNPMIRFFDIADRARLPWRFTGAARSVLSRL